LDLALSALFLGLLLLIIAVAVLSSQPEDRCRRHDGGGPFGVIR
jgi:hypothetical protein